MIDVNSDAVGKLSKKDKDIYDRAILEVTELWKRRKTDFVQEDGFEYLVDVRKVPASTTLRGVEDEDEEKDEEERGRKEKRRKMLAKCQKFIVTSTKYGHGKKSLLGKIGVVIHDGGRWINVLVEVGEGEVIRRNFGINDFKLV